MNRARSTRWVAAVVMVPVLAGAACGGGGGLDRAEVLAALGEAAIVPAYETFATAGADLDAAATSLCAGPDGAGVERAAAALAGARAAWKRSEAMWLGPVMDRRSPGVVDWPVDPDGIEEVVGDGEPLDEERIRSQLGADQRGLGAVELVLGTGTPDDVAVALGDVRRCDYLTAVTAVVAAEGRALAEDWSRGSAGAGPYREELAGQGSAAVDELVNDEVFLLEAMTDRELGRALGLMEGGADPTAIVEGPAGLGVVDLQARLEGLRAVLVGIDGEGGLGPLLGDDLTGRLTAQTDEAAAALADVAALDVPLREAVETSPATVQAAMDVLNVLQVTVATEVVSRLGVTLGFSDADGDSG